MEAIKWLFDGIGGTILIGIFNTIRKKLMQKPENNFEITPNKNSQPVAIRIEGGGGNIIDSNVFIGFENPVDIVNSSDNAVTKNIMKKD